MKNTNSIRSGWLTALAAICTGLLLAACHEIPQDARKPFASEVDVKPQAGEPFGGDKQKFEAALTERATHSDDYELIGASKP